ncbi:MAG: ferredoxin [Bacteroidales bacterium]|nr:ferredoxin [Bacteroidales bacterium]
MGINKVWIDPGCISCGNCESVCPEVFEVTDECHVIADAPLNEYEEGIRVAAEECPVHVIQYEEG